MKSPSQPSEKVTPMMAQWHSCKKIAKEAVLLFRMGDFYEAFYDDAKLLSDKINLTLTKRQGIPMCGVPFHSSEGYIDKLVALGLRVAIAEQVEDPKEAKGLVKREVVRIVTPGTTYSQHLVPDKSNNFFVALDQVGTVFGLALLDLSTAEFEVIEFENSKELFNEIFRLKPSEGLCSEKFLQRNPSLISQLKESFLLNTRDSFYFNHENAYNTLKTHFQVHSLDSFGLKGKVAAINASGALLHYLQEDLKLPLHHLQSLKTYHLNNYLSLDYSTQKHLELTESLHEQSKKNTLLQVLDHTQTPMGGRLLKRWIKQPLLSVQAIQERLDTVEALMQNLQEGQELPEELKTVYDLERLMMKISSGYAGPRDLLALKISLKQIPLLKSILAPINTPLMKRLYAQLFELPELLDDLEKAIREEAPLRSSDGGFIKEGYHPELDQLLQLKNHSQQFLVDYQQKLRQQTDIKTLKVGFNKVFGYFIEVSKGQADKMPSQFSRRQTLVNSERFISPELKEFESKILHAEEKIAAIESQLFQELKQKVLGHQKSCFSLAHALAQIDVLQSLASVSLHQHYTRPSLKAPHPKENVLEINEGRHPVIERLCQNGQFIPNNTQMDSDKQRLFIITGPNMAGKSTYIRQVAMIVIMAQMGCFVPAESCTLSIIDKVFSRIGASDDLSRGQSTFMVEMNETANILNNATSNSLVILDEIGRGTSTYDGISIAWAVAEYLLNTPGKQAKTLFATHYWELTLLEQRTVGAVNYSVAVKEWNDEIIFLHKIVRGGTDKSYGIQVARLAGLPKPAIKRAKEILNTLEKSRQNPEQKSRKKEQQQLLLFEKPAPLAPETSKAPLQQLQNQLLSLNLNDLTPLQALNLLQDLKQKAQS